MYRYIRYALVKQYTRSLLVYQCKIPQVMGPFCQHYTSSCRHDARRTALNSYRVTLKRDTPVFCRHAYGTTSHLVNISQSSSHFLQWWDLNPDRGTVFVNGEVKANFRKPFNEMSSFLVYIHMDVMSIYDIKKQNNSYS